MNGEALIFKELCENSFQFYAKQYLKVVEPETEFEWNWHLDMLCHYCEQLYYGDIKNLDINIPPRTLKSIIVSVLFPTWVWTKDPSKKFLCASSSSALSVKLNIKRRDLIDSKQYQVLWPVFLREDSNTTKRFGNYDGGFMQAVSAEGKVTGDGGDFLISDDLLDAKDAFSEKKRQGVRDWYSTVFYGRVQSKKHSRRININQRLHVKDVSGLLEEMENFERLIIPMVKTDKDLSTVKGFKDPRQTGEFLHPSRYSQTDMDDDYKALGVYGWSSQFQQSPRPIGGGIIKEEWIRWYKGIISDCETYIITADLNMKKKKTANSYACFMCWGKSGNKKYLIDVVRGRWSYKETKDNFRIFCEKNYTAYRKWVEDKANGPALISDLEKEIQGIRAWPEDGSPYAQADKVQRLHMVSQEYEMGNVYLPEDIELAKTYLDELTGFTESGSTTGNDDMVDTGNMALIELKKENRFYGEA